MGLSTKTAFGLATIVALIGACAAEEPLGENSWALLVASSGVADGDEWDNYCIQASVCHGYHTVLATGIPAERIIVMMPDDVANNPLNTCPGKIFDRPNGTDVYAGVKIDYRGEDVTPNNFLNILSGKKEAMAGKGTGRVIERSSTGGERLMMSSHRSARLQCSTDYSVSDANTNLFVYLSDHGDYQLVRFNDVDLYANQLLSTIEAMHSQKKYNKMFFYLEACLSGSMFDMYPADLNVFAMTAANATECAHMCYCDSDINGACLAIEFSAGWAGLLDSDSCPIHMPRTEAHLRYLKWQVSHAKDAESLKEAQANLDKYIQEEEKLKELKSKLLQLFASEYPEIETLHLNGVVLPSDPQSRICYQDVVTHFNENCVRVTRFFGALTIFANACVMELDMSMLKREMTSICEPYKALIS